jgi:hypothetical protein
MFHSMPGKPDLAPARGRMVRRMSLRRSDGGLDATLSHSHLTRDDVDALIGLMVDEARAEAKRRGMFVRVIRSFNALHRDLRLNRANVRVRRGRVREVLWIG